MDKNLVYLVQTDTTVGFLSNNDKKLASIKKRENTKKILRVVDNFKTLKTHTRIPKKHRKLIRNSKSTTFIYPNGESFRVVDKNSHHHSFIKKFGVLYSTSANETKKNFDMEYAIKNTNIQLITKIDYYEGDSSTIIKINSKKISKIR